MSQFKIQFTKTKLYTPLLESLGICVWN